MPQLTYQEFEQMRLDVPTDELIQKASDALSELCKTGARSFVMTVPPRLSDTDIVFADLINRFKVERTKVKELVEVIKRCKLYFAENDRTPIEHHLYFVCETILFNYQNKQQ